MTQNPPIDEGSAIPGVPHRWTALTIALTAIGFVVFWPLGLAMLVYVLWGERILAEARSESGIAAKVKRATEDLGRTFREEFRPRGAADAAGGASRGSCGFGAFKRTGNAQFDAWRDAELRRLDEERRKLDETTAAFEAHLRAERGAHDDSRQREEFDRFMSGRHQG
ncbi:DUF2852 domain-containing protein [Chenggangzhangella methanolivorans]|uniref:DUF2852 domain-containing protein n=1 Tax=Chenggangzhangella methanolivorans TaxID=1437009 RepID=A0A9E6RA62_9HYPH|nr:DUF2852 domain-containing protein [Chenggangzhangella methanolivorans]QZN99472.1 DUF2852 domain-containing protein [Chenggangzhangella methanolivorans]